MTVKPPLFKSDEFCAALSSSLNNLPVNHLQDFVALLEFVYMLPDALASYKKNPMETLIKRWEDEIGPWAPVLVTLITSLRKFIPTRERPTSRAVFSSRSKEARNV